MSRLSPILVTAILLVGCYNHKKANQQHGRAVATYPEIGAEFCATTYPPRDSIVKGDSVIELQIIYEDTGSTRIDTVTVENRVIVTKTVTLPAKTVYKTVTNTDTVYRINEAELKACNIEKGKLAAALLTEQTRADKYQGQAKTRGWALIGLLAAVGVWLYFKLTRKK